jgi:hypothetical protein
VSVNTTNDSLHVHDGSTASGFELARVDGSNWAITNNISTTANISFGDNDKAIFGAGSDLQIYHDGSNSYISEVGTGELVIQARDAVTIEDGTSSDNYIYMQRGNKVSLFYAGAEKLATTSTGIDVTGTVTADGLTVDGASAGTVTAATFANTTSASGTRVQAVLQNVGSACNVNLISERVGANFGADFIVETSDTVDGTDRQRLRIAETGDISFYEDTGTTPKFFWDASAESLGINTTSPSNYASGLVSYNTPITVVGDQYDGNFFNSVFFGGSAENLTYRNIIRNSLSSTPANQKMQFSVANGASTHADVLTLTGSGNVGIGSSSPAAQLEVEGATNSTYLIVGGDDSSNGRALTFTSSASASFNGAVHTINAPSSQGVIALATSSSERMRIDSSGNLLVGKTASNYNTAGIEIDGSNDRLFVTRAGTPVLINRKSSDGALVSFYRDTTAVGSIFSHSSGNMGIGTGATGVLFAATSNSIQPWNPSSNAVRDNTIDLGIPGGRWKDIYRSGSTYQTSDRNMKQDIRDLTDAERNVAVAAKGLLKAFRFIDTVASEGDSANIHFGIIAQDLAAAFEAEGLDANDYQVYKSATTTDDEGNEQNSLNVCYENLLAFIIAAI